ncbi:putative 67.3 kDa coat protein [Nephila clavipes virus 2]|uniref:putative 67.3 kDa coat protein n=1 Tax=Nephila clavipes virus 2 TaxID=2108205 RepID=UPI000D212F48|nr:putative 67.3 kDa coat protein [Nephila clavipes virus 2]AVK59475.1 putative 67.3 kDa coat protein [Nephila clavipes virus 2]
MSDLNAPQPTPGGSANNEEVFDSTIVPSQGQVSQDQMPGPDNREAPMHSGEMNGVDPFFYTQWMALVSFVWDTSMSPGQLLWFIPIHPTFVHQWMGHVSKMYNAFAGGFDFAISIAGTGFHAGKLMIVRLPPNIHPETLKTVADVTAFPYFVIDPKTLQVVTKSAMDQRNVMYHYLPYNKDNIQSFGGYIAVYVMLPLNTSSTGATQISLQVLTKPAQDFMFTQLIPIRSDVLNEYKPSEIMPSLDFRFPKFSPLFGGPLKNLTCWTSTAKKWITREVFNCKKLDGTFIRQGDRPGSTYQTKYILPQTDSLTLKLENFPDKKVKSLRVKLAYLDTVQGGLATQILSEPESGKICFSFENFCPDPKQPEVFFPNFRCENALISFINRSTPDYPNAGPAWPCSIVQKTPTDPQELFSNIVLIDGKVVEQYYKYKDGLVTPPAELDGFIDDLFLKQGMTVVIKFLKDVSLSTSTVSWAPPIPESIITFETDVSSAAQPYELSNYLASYNFKDTITEHECLLWQLQDTKVDLPILPIKLHFNGCFTTLNLKENVIYDLTDGRYKLEFLGVTQETTPLQKVKGVLKTSQYAQNMVVSRMASTIV